MPNNFPTRKLGKKGPEVSALGLGCMGMSAFYGTNTWESSHELLDHSANAGCTFWDTSDMYADNESMIGEWFKKTGRRNEIFLATKFAVFVKADGTRGIRGDPEYVHQACASSLKKLGVDHFDLYYAHRMDPKVPIEKTVGAMAELVKAGKVKHIGLSECSADTLRRGHAIHPIAAVQLEYSPFALDIETDQTPLLKAARELGVAVIAYSPLGRGLLTGKYKSPNDFEEGDFRRHMPRFSEENFGKNLVLVDKISELAKKKGCTPGQITLAWLMAQGEDIIPIPGTKKIHYLDENLGAVKVNLTKQEVEEIREVSNNAQVAGSRYPEASMQSCFADTPPL